MDLFDNTANVIEIRKLTKAFGKNQIIDELDFDLPKGVIYGIRGHNGAGKSVLLKIISGLMLPDQGTVSVFGKQIGKDLEFAPKTGILIDGGGFLTALGARRNLELLAQVSGTVSKDRIVEVLQLVGLKPDDHKPVGTYSTGMKQRLGLAAAIMEEPEILLLDEPTNGLDIDGQRDIYTLLSEWRNQGKTILLTSHSIDEMKILCDKVFVLNQMKLTPFHAPGIGEEDY